MFQLKRAIKEQVNLIIMLAGGTGSGKTTSALRLATGICGGKRFAVIDTENGRALHMADQFDFDCGQLREPFSPMAYLEAIEAADAAGYPVIVVDSASHEHAGAGGLLDMHEAELDRMAGDDYAKRERVKMAAWIRPKTDHKRFVQKLLQIKAHLILCFRAAQQIEMVKKDGRMEIVPKKSLVGLDGWVPIAEKNLPFEASASFLLVADRPGVPHPIKLPAMLRDCFPPDKLIDEDSGKRVAAWAAGGKAPALAARKAAASNGTKDHLTTVANVIVAFDKLGVTTADLEFMLADGADSKPKDDWTAADVDTLRGVYREKLEAAKGVI